MKRNFTWFFVTLFSIAIAAFVLLASGCSTAKPKGGTADSPAKATTAVPPPALAGGADLWARNCGHCHNIRSPSSYSDAQWEVVMMHMRVRANLTADEHRKILAFLKTAH